MSYSRWKEEYVGQDLCNDTPDDRMNVSKGNGQNKMIEIHSLGKIDTKILEKEFGKIQTDEIIITDERINHIKIRHPEDYALFEEYGEACVASPDVILKDIKNEGTVFMIQ